MNNLRRIIYILKRRYGAPIDLYRETKGQLDPLTGKTVVRREKYHIRKAIVMPANTQFNNPLVTSIAKLSGVTITINRNIFIDAKDIVIVPQEDNYIDYRGTRYDIVRTEQFDENNIVRVYIITVKETQKEPSTIIDTPIIHEYIPIAEEFKYYPPTRVIMAEQLVLSESFSND